MRALALLSALALLYLVEESPMTSSAATLLTPLSLLSPSSLDSTQASATRAERATGARPSAASPSAASPSAASPSAASPAAEHPSSAPPHSSTPERHPEASALEADRRAAPQVLKQRPSIDADGWLAEDRRCQRRGRRFFCDGPRRAPKPYGPAAELAKELGLGDKDVYFTLRSPGEPPTSWLATAALAEALDESAQKKWVWPVPEGFLGRRFGRVREGRLRHRPHLGIDIPAASGADIVATRSGLVVYSDNGIEGYGNSVMILHADGSTAFYAHCETISVFAGQLVRAGTPIANVGTTGLSRASHLHFELWRRGRPRNPLIDLRERPSHEVEERLQREQAARRREGEARLQALRERAARRHARKLARSTREASSS